MLEEWKQDLVRDTRTGRLLRLGADAEVTVVLDGLAFANGVALASDESFVAVAETGARTVVRRWLAGPRAGERDFLATDLPGYPDNIARGSDGLIWVTLASPVDPVLEDKIFPQTATRTAGGTAMGDTQIVHDGRTFYDGEQNPGMTSLRVQDANGDWLLVQYPHSAGFDTDAMVAFLDSVVVKPGAVGAGG